MRCIKCQAKAVTEIRQHNAAYCAEHFFGHFENQVRRNIRRYRMCAEKDRILVAVSGGKDSLALWDVLVNFGYQTAGLHIHLGIGGYSDKGLEAAQGFARARNLELITVNVAQDYGMAIPELAQTLRRAPCSGCGLTRRYIFNREASERGYNVLATGHNLDDEAATLLGNVLHWDMEHLPRQHPALETTHPKFVRKIKPLYTLSEKETATYCLLKRIRYHADECPNAAGARSLIYKHALNEIELNSPGAKLRFVRGFLEKARAALSAQPVALRECLSCGQPTTTERCAFCRLWDQALARRKKSQAVRLASFPAL
ncbi:MAG TPA: ATP-binding protein [Candidatus Acidoferrales bacterium]|nr:ATP-binding protein [Candidatus Acidoferrales bacterium]